MASGDGQDTQLEDLVCLYYMGTETTSHALQGAESVAGCRRTYGQACSEEAHIGIYSILTHSWTASLSFCLSGVPQNGIPEDGIWGSYRGVVEENSKASLVP